MPWDSALRYLAEHSDWYPLVDFKLMVYQLCSEKYDNRNPQKVLNIIGEFKTKAVRGLVSQTKAFPAGEKYYINAKISGLDLCLNRIRAALELPISHKLRDLTLEEFRMVRKAEERFYDCVQEMLTIVQVPSKISDQYQSNFLATKGVYNSHSFRSANGLA